MHVAKISAKTVQSNRDSRKDEMKNVTQEQVAWKSLQIFSLQNKYKLDKISQNNIWGLWKSKKMKQMEKHLFLSCEDSAVCGSSMSTGPKLSKAWSPPAALAIQGAPSEGKVQGSPWVCRPEGHGSVWNKQHTS